MKYTKFALAIAVCLLCGLAVVGLVRSGLPAAVSTNARKIACSFTSGRFENFVDRCITRSCYARHDCFADYPDLNCRALKAGDPIEEVYFQLGEPFSQDGSPYVWHSKAGDTKITAEIEDGKLKSLSCPRE